MRDKLFDVFYKGFCEQVSLAKDNEMYGWEDQDFFTMVMLDYLEEAGEVEDVVICPYRAYGLQMNAYMISDNQEEVSLFVSVYNESSECKTVSKTSINASVKRGLQLYRKAVNDLYESFEKDNDTYEFAITINKNKYNIEKLRIIILTNGNIKPIEFQDIVLENTTVTFQIWDMDRLFRCMSSGKKRETIEIDFKNTYRATVPCIYIHASENYKTYLAVFNGLTLAKIYDDFNARLLQKNVRSFLQVRGKVNKGIRYTLQNDPDMFLAYNNGISVTTESVKIEKKDGNTCITKIKDMQIVNGGQTTVSIYNAYKDKKVVTDLSKVFVQAKISVVDNAENIDEVVKNISEFSNTQNKIQMADFSANDPFHCQIEELSRTIWTPVQNGSEAQNWFYERARGQYSDMLLRETTPSRKRQFKQTHPMFSRTDLAKFENTWDQLPYYVSEGAQKNFRRFTLQLGERKDFVPNEIYYKKLIAKAILYRQTEKLVQEQKYGGYRANIVTYTLAFLSNKTAQKIDLETIWKNQSLSMVLKGEIVKVSRIVHNYIVNPPDGANISEWCKKKKCWDGLLNEADYTLNDDLAREMIDEDCRNEVIMHTKSSESDMNMITFEEQEVINEVYAVEAGVWFGISKWARDTKNLEVWQRSLAFSLGTLKGRQKKPSYKQAIQGQKIYKIAKEKGFAV